MALLKILRHPDPRLRKVARPVTTVNERTRRLVDDMFETMYANHGVGLAATQVDVHERVIVLDVSEHRDEPLVLINPELRMRSAEMAMGEEGCLSVPGAIGVVSRHVRVKVQALDRDGRCIELMAQGRLAVCIQHELEHLSGQVFVDKLGPLRRSPILQVLRHGPGSVPSRWALSPHCDPR